MIDSESDIHGSSRNNWRQEKWQTIAVRRTVAFATNMNTWYTAHRWGQELNIHGSLPGRQEKWQPNQAEGSLRR